MPSFFKVLFSRRMLVAALMGFSCGLALPLTGAVLKAWMKDEGVDLTVIGLMALVTLPYSIKFLWSPVLDRITLPFLGRRRGWLLTAQVLLALSIAWMGMTNPGRDPWLVALAAMIVTFFSASQDIVVDAYRREDLSDEELGLGSSLYVYGYRVGMLLASGGGLIMADRLSFGSVYLIMAVCMVPGIVTTLFTVEPETVKGVPQSFREAVFEPFMDYFRRHGAVWVLLFILAYKIGDQLASAMTMPFYLDIGFTKTQIGSVVNLYGFWASLVGFFAGGAVILRTGIYRSLWIFGVLQAVSTAGFAVLNIIGPSLVGLGCVITFENFTSGMGTSAFVAFMASLTNKRFTATQYALLTSLMAFSRDIITSPSGLLAKHMGWTGFFVACTLIAIPGMLLLLSFSQDEVKGQSAGAGAEA